MKLAWPAVFALACPALALHTSGRGAGGQAPPPPPPPRLVARQDQQASYPSVDTFIRRFHPSMVRLSNQLIVDGGSVSRLFNGSHKVNSVNITLSIPLDSSWTNSTLVMTEISRAILPNNNAPVLWSDDEAGAVYSYGGDPVSPDTSYTSTKRLYKLDGSGGTQQQQQPAWATSEPASAAEFSQLYNPARTSFTTCGGLGIALGGFANSNTDNRVPSGDTIPLPWLVTYDFATRAWANRSIADAFDVQLRGFYPAGGSAVCLPTLGAAGVVMFLGGRALAADGRDVPVPFDRMIFYDIATSTWRTQSTTATTDGLPEHRRDACAAAARGRNGSYEVFLFGGRPVSSDNKARSDMWVLTIPGFRWFKASGPAAQQAEGRAFLSCAAVGRQLVVVGGVSEQSNKQWTVPQTDPWSQGVGVFDMQQLSWRDGYKHDLETYDSPEIVQEWYRGGGVANWDAGGMEEFFTEAASTPGVAPTEGVTSPANSSGGLSQSATIGIAVGVSLAGLLVIAALVWFCIRRRRSTSQPPAELPDGAITNSHHQTLANPSSTFIGSTPSPGLAATSPWSKSELAAGDRGILDHQPQQQQQQPPAELQGEQPPMQPYEVGAFPPSAPGGAYPVHELRG